jgi:diguanylate cyclase (GGDEF)-like protein/PAS domain S-box-containing protein
MPEQKKASIYMSLRTVLILPYTTLILVSIVAVVFISYWNGQAAVNDVARQLRSEITLGLKEHLLTFLLIPHHINQENAAAIQSGQIQLNDPEGLQQHFLHQVMFHDTVTSVYFGNTEGGVVGSGRELDNSFYVTRTVGFKSGEFQKIKLDENGVFVFPAVASIPNFDARTRPWYLGAVHKGGETWSDIYVLVTGQELAIAASRPVYDKSGNLLGVVSVDLFLSQVSHYLETLTISQIGQVFIMEPNGELVATSTNEPLFQDNGTGGKEQRLVQDSQSDVIREAGSLLLEKHGGYQNIPGEEQQIEFTAHGEQQFMQYLTVSDPYGLHWVVAIIIPESAFMERINEGNTQTMQLILIALVVAISISVFISTKISNRIKDLDESSQALSQGDWEHALEENTRIEELKGLAVSFNQMKDQLRSSMNALATEVEERKRAEMELKSQHDFLSTVFNMMGQGLAVTDADGRFEFVNPSCARLFGYEPNALIGKFPDEITVVEDRKILEEQRKLREAGISSTYETRLVCADGKIANVLITGVPRGDGKNKGAISVITDVSEQKRIEEALKEATNALELALIREQKLARTDKLTGINNRRSLFELAEFKFEVAKRYKQALAMIIFDVDHFKKVNDAHGHLVGDQTLAEVTKLVRTQLRNADAFGRYGGEEFVILMPMTNARQAFNLAERIRKKVEDFHIKSEQGNIISVTISLGISEIDTSRQDETVEKLFNRADEAMYLAKQAGRNCTRSLE